MSRARLERDIKGAARWFGGFPQRRDLGVGRSGGAVPPLGNELAIANQNRADCGIRVGFSKPLPRLANGETHEHFIELSSGHARRSEELLWPLSRVDRFPLPREDATHRVEV